MLTATEHDLPHDALRAIERAAGQLAPGAELMVGDFALLDRAGRSGAVEPARFAAMMNAMSRGRSLAEASREMFDLTMDYLYGFGFRDPALPEISDDYCVFMMETARALGFDDNALAQVCVEVIVGRPELALSPQITGEAFVLILERIASLRGVPFPYPPARHYMTREALGQINAALYRLGLGADHYSQLLAAEGGGCLRGRDLDRAGSQRVLARLIAAGYAMAEPPPRVEGKPGFITQPQANLIWRLWQDIGGLDGDTSAASLDRWLGYVGGLACLTAAGAGKLIGEWLAPAIERRRAADAACREGRARAWKTPACSERAVMAADSPAGTEAPENP